MRRSAVVRAVAGALVASVALALGGCSPQEKLVPAEGVVKIGGRPAANISLQFMPDATKGATGPTSYGTTDADGKFRLQTHKGRAGAVPGWHTIILADMDEERPPQGKPAKKQPRLGSQYTTAAGGLKAEVKEGGGAIELNVP